MDQFDRDQRMREYAQIGHERLDRAERARRSRAGYPLGDYDSDFTTRRLLLSVLAIVVFVVVFLALSIAFSDDGKTPAGVGDDSDAAAQQQTQAITRVQPPAWLVLASPPRAEETQRSGAAERGR